MNDTTYQGSGEIAFVPVVVNAKQHPQTNADLIRNMTDEELAKFISDKARTFGEEYEGYLSALDWLKSPVEEDE